MSCSCAVVCRHGKVVVESVEIQNMSSVSLFVTVCSSANIKSRG